MNFSKPAKIAVVFIGIGIVWRLYNLYKLTNKLTYSVSGISVARQGLNLFVSIQWDILNQTSTSVKVKSIVGRLFINNNWVSDFKGPELDVKPGLVKYRTTFAIDNLGVVTAIIAAISSKKYPIFNVEMATDLGLFAVKNKFDIDSAEYINRIV